MNGVSHAAKLLANFPICGWEESALFSVVTIFSPQFVHCAHEIFNFIILFIRVHKGM
jgi:hypothetical protein